MKLFAFTAGLGLSAVQLASRLRFDKVSLKTFPCILTCAAVFSTAPYLFAQIPKLRPGESILITKAHRDTTIRWAGFDDFSMCGWTLENRHSAPMELSDLNLAQDTGYVVLFQYIGDQPPLIPSGYPWESYCYTAIKFGLTFPDYSTGDYLAELHSRRATVIDQHYIKPFGESIRLRSELRFGSGLIRDYNYPFNDFMLRIVLDSGGMLRLYFAEGDNPNIPDSS